MNSKIALLAQVPNEIIIEIFKHTDITTKTKFNMIIIFPWLSKYIPKCEICNENNSHFITRFNYGSLRIADRKDVFNCSNYINCFDSLSYYECYKSTYICKLDCGSLHSSLKFFIIGKDHVITSKYAIVSPCMMCNKNVLFAFNASGIRIQLTKN